MRAVKVRERTIRRELPQKCDTPSAQLPTGNAGEPRCDNYNGRRTMGRLRNAQKTKAAGLRNSEITGAVASNKARSLICPSTR